MNNAMTPEQKSAQHQKIESIRAAAELLRARAAEEGVVLTMEQRPLAPLAMGHYETVISVRPTASARKALDAK